MRTIQLLCSAFVMASVACSAAAEERSDSSESAIGVPATPPVKPWAFHDFGDIAAAPYDRGVVRHVNGSTRYRIRVGGDDSIPINAPSTVTVRLSHETDVEYKFTVRDVDDVCSFTPEVYEDLWVRPNKRTSTVRIKTYGRLTLEIVVELKSKPSRGPTLLGVEERYSSSPGTPVTCPEDR